jgi:hypothetical protein
MGFYLLHESMLQSVLVARDRWLRPGGLMMPSRARIHAAPVSLRAFRRSTIDFWDDLHGFNLTALKPRAWDAAMASPLVRTHASLHTPDGRPPRYLRAATFQSPGTRGGSSPTWSWASLPGRQAPGPRRATPERVFSVGCAQQSPLNKLN